MIKKIQTKSALHKIKGAFPYSWDLNIYRGCRHRCKYCYAIYSHHHLDSTNFFGKIRAKENIPEILDKELSKSSWKKEVINMGGVTDSYQPIEKNWSSLAKS